MFIYKEKVENKSNKKGTCIVKINDKVSKNFTHVIINNILQATDNLQGKYHYNMTDDEVLFNYYNMIKGDVRVTIYK